MDCHVPAMVRQAAGRGARAMILVGVGSNLAAPGHATAAETAAAALAELPRHDIAVLRASRWFLSEPVPPSDQPWYVNGVATIATDLSPHALLDALQAVEAAFGRTRSMPNAARTLDLDLLDYNGLEYASVRLVLPHPRLHERRFVLAPLAEIAPGWRHPRLTFDAGELLRRLPAGQPVRLLGDNAAMGG